MDDRWHFFPLRKSTLIRECNRCHISGVEEEFGTRVGVEVDGEEEQDVDDADTQNLDESNLETVDVTNLKNLDITSFIQAGKCDCCGEPIDTAHTVR